MQTENFVKTVGIKQTGKGQLKSNANNLSRGVCAYQFAAEGKLIYKKKWHSKLSRTDLSGFGADWENLWLFFTSIFIQFNLVVTVVLHFREIE